MKIQNAVSKTKLYIQFSKCEKIKNNKTVYNVHQVLVLNLFESGIFSPSSVSSSGSSLVAAKL
jgi:hypothetical protein